MEQSHVTIWDHVRLLHSSLSQSLVGRKILYLDTHCWVGMCDIQLGRKADPRCLQLLELLTPLKADGRILCVASSSLMAEIDSQSDDSTRQSTAELVSAFSDNVCLLAMHPAMRLEFKEHITKCLLREFSPNMKPQYFTRPAWIFGATFPVPNIENVLEAEKLLIAKVGADWAWGQTFSEVLRKQLGLEAKRIAAETAEILKGVGQEWLKQGLTFDQMRVQIQSMYTQQLLDDLPAILQELDNEYPHLVGELRDPTGLAFEKSVKLMPHVQVLASIFAELIVNKVNTINANDVIDAEHATMALPLCDALFLDRGAAHRLIARSDAIGVRHGKTVIGNMDDAILYLRGLI
jgi:hypothetical protein